MSSDEQPIAVGGDAAERGGGGLQPSGTASGGRDDSEGLDSPMLMDEVKLILAEKRTSLSVLRTGIAVFVLPLSVLSLLVSTSSYYEFSKVLALLLPLLVLCVLLILLGSYLVVRALLRIHHHDRRVQELKERYDFLKELVE
ncbi:MAG: hypothetical protein SWC40_03710 [Thermodesulfobacteriota bacterium]|nr:hypothetical protein [Thermodesulfobacteriota bacterium]